MADYKKNESKEWAKSHLKGQWSTLVSPFNSDGSLDSNGLTSNINHIVDLGVSGIGCTWGMGEFWSLTLAERMEIYDLVAEHAGDKVQIAAHVTHSAFEDMIKLAEKAQNTEFDLLIVTSPYVVTKNPKQVFEFVSKLAIIGIFSFFASATAKDSMFVSMIKIRSGVFFISEIPPNDL